MPEIETPTEEGPLGAVSKGWRMIRRMLRSRTGGHSRTSAPQAPPAASGLKRSLAAPRRFAYSPPPARDAVKQVVLLARSDILRGAVHVIRRGGEESLHLHEGQDGFWMVLRGRARFHGPDDTILGEFGEHEGILIPRDCAYWFESVGECDLELLQLLAFDRRGSVTRRNLEPRRLDSRHVVKLDGRIASATDAPDR